MKRQIITILAAALLAVPAAGATWFAYGTYEPDTLLDFTGGYMQKDHNVDVTAKKLYFNVYQTEFPAGMSINNGLAGSRHIMAGIQNYNAILGPWVDCNGDKYVGTIESGMPVYPSALADPAICPVGNIFETHNDGQWVYEYIPVGYQHAGCGGTCETSEATASRHQVILEDREALVWGDAGLPGAQGGGTCPISPFPHGTTAGTGWMMRYLDCFTSNRIKQTTNDVSTTVDPSNSLGLYWDDMENPQKSSSVLNQHFPESLFGNPTTGETGTLQLDSEEDGGSREHAFTTWDCSGRTAEVKDTTGLAPQSVVVNDPTFDGQDSLVAGNYGKIDVNFTDSDGNYAWVARPAPNVIDPTDSVADGLNETFRGFHVGGRDDESAVDGVADEPEAGGDCDTVGDDEDGDNSYSEVHQTVFFRFDAPFEPSSTSAKRETTDYFYFYNGCEMEGDMAALFGPNAPNSIVSTPPTQYIGTQGCADPIWQSNTLWLTVPQSINRATLQPTGAIYWTYYARVGTTTLGAGYTPAGGEGTYGSEACGSFTTGVHNGWDCDQSHWYTDSEGTPIVDQGTPWQGKVGYKYQFRDIDCYDGTVARGSGVRASLTDLAPNPAPCADAP